MFFESSTADNLGVGLFKYSISPEEKFIVTNSTFVSMLGYQSKNDIKKEKIGTLFSSPKAMQEFLSGLQKDGKVSSMEVSLKKKSGEAIWVAITASKEIDQDNKECISGIIKDISSYKNAEDDLTLEGEFIQGLLENLPDAVYFKDRKNQIIRANKFYASSIGYKPEEIIGKTDYDLFPKERAKKMFEDDNYVLSTGSTIIGKIERTFVSDGKWSQAITTKVPVYGQNGKIIGTLGITKDMTAHANLEKERLLMLVNALTILVKILETRDPYTSSHTQQVAEIAERIGRALGWDENRVIILKLAGKLHDLGKISIPLDLLNKPGKLSDLEYRLIQEHVNKCYSLIKEIKFPFSLAEIVYQHHERLDGSGYPQRLKREDIRPEARILAVSDVLESMTNYRPYREALGLDRAIIELKRGSGIKYDAKIVKIVLKLIKESNGKPFWIEVNEAHKR